MTAPDSKVFKASFNPLIKPFLVLRIGFILAATIIGLPLAVIWFLGVGRWWAKHYYDKLECDLSETSLRFRKGILVQVEKTIPLENIQDVTFLEGPILRHFQLSTLKFETAANSMGRASDMQLTGIIDAHEFRGRIMLAREALKKKELHWQGFRDASSATPSDALLAEQLAALRGIERRLDEILQLTKKNER